MIVCSYNIRGLGGRIKKSKVFEFVNKNHFDSLAIQETKLVVVDDSLCHSLWGYSSHEWSFSPALGDR
jgi:exonuclease III